MVILLHLDKLKGHYNFKWIYNLYIETQFFLYHLVKVIFKRANLYYEWRNLYFFCSFYYKPDFPKCVHTHTYNDVYFVVNVICSSELLPMFYLQEKITKMSVIIFLREEHQKGER